MPAPEAHRGFAPTSPSGARASPSHHDELPVAVGELVDDKYRVERLIGRGGMGCVVLATHVQILQRVALKFLTKSTGDPDARARFLREARAAAVLTSDHVARVLDVGVLPEGTPFLVMEYLEGQDLGKRIQESGALPIQEAVRIVMQACDALGEAHERGIVHRDVKPPNIFLSQRPTGAIVVKVLDFGIAKMTDASLSVDQITGTATVMGTPQYMAPEQMTSPRNVDARADVWALGVVLYHCLTRRLPFETETILELGARVLGGKPTPITVHRDDLSPSLLRVIDRCLEKDPAQRFANAVQLHAALAEARRSGLSRESATTLAAPMTGPLTPPPAIRGMAAETARFPATPPQALQPSGAAVLAPSLGGLAAVRAMDTEPSGRGRNPVLLAAAGVIALSFAVLAVVVQGRSGTPAPPPPVVATPTPPPPTTAEPTATPAPTAFASADPALVEAEPSAVPSATPASPSAGASRGPLRKHHVAPPRPPGRPSAAPTTTALTPPNER